MTAFSWYPRAITVESDDGPEIARATERLLNEILRRNEIVLDDIASVLFTLTPDLHAAFPALAARQHAPALGCPVLHPEFSLTIC